MLVLALLALSPARAANDPRKREPTSWDVTLSPPGEPGEPFEMSGRVLSERGVALRNTKVFVYHADSHGLYALHAKDYVRLAAVLRTDSLGRYRFHSVFPGSYGYPPHVHFETLSGQDAAGFVNVRKEGVWTPWPQTGVPARRDSNGVWRVHWDLRPGYSGPVGRWYAAPEVPEFRYPSRADSATKR